jgi:Immunoglobulin-like domain of bacterial spore germination
MPARRATAVAVALVVLLGACDDGGETAETGGDSTTSTTEAPTTTAAPTTTSGSVPVGGLEQPALWPSPEIVFNDPIAAATDFLDLVIGAGEAGEFRQGDSRSGEVDVLFRGEGGGQEIVRSTLLLRQLGEEDGWFVIAAVNPNAAITSPEAGATISLGSPFTVEGVARGFEGNVVVSARPAGVAGEPFDEAVTTAGALADPEPFTVELTVGTASPGDVVMLLVQGGVGLEADPGDFGAIPVVAVAT